MEVYRIAQESYASDLSGNGSKLFGGRWNSEGQSALYTAATRSLALLETLAHVPAKLLGIRKYMLITVFVPDNVSCEIIEISDLPRDWDALDVQPVTQMFGNKFLKQENRLLLRVPSVLVPEEYNYIINPLAEEMNKVRITYQREIRFNDRLMKSF